MTYRRRWSIWALLAALAVMLGFSWGVGSEPAADSKESSPPPGPVSLEVARDRAQLMHDVYAATLEVMHHRYFHDARAIVPARALEDVFAEMDSRANISARWISVNTKPMSLHHEPKSDFEKKAAAEIAAGKSPVEQVDGAMYRRAVAIPLTGGCVSCHAGMFADAPKTQRYAGLVISIPIEESAGSQP
ncbi:MAG: c-type heme family protein [Aureliella sp.]